MVVTVSIDERVLAPNNLLLGPSGCVLQILTGIFFLIFSFQIK